MQNRNLDGFSERVRAALIIYDQARGRVRRFFGNNHPFIDALLALAVAERNNRAIIERCFAAHRMDETHASYRVYLAFQADWAANDNNNNNVHNFILRLPDLDQILGEVAERRDAVEDYRRIANFFRDADADQNNRDDVNPNINQYERIEIRRERRERPIQEYFAQIRDYRINYLGIEREPLINNEDIINELGGAVERVVHAQPVNINRLLEHNRYGYDRGQLYREILDAFQNRDVGDIFAGVDLFRGAQPHARQQPPPPAPDLNNSQSTHLASVHASTSESAKKLHDRYHRDLEGQATEALMVELTQNISNCEGEHLKKEAAFNCLTRLMDGMHNFTDPLSQVTTQQLIFMTYLALRDAVKQGLVSHEDAMSNFIEALYEIQRGYNLSQANVDDGQDDKPICAAGTFNKFIEKLQAIDPDCEVRVITQETASLKLPIIVKSEIANYLNTLEKPEAIIKAIESDGIEVIWDKIENAIKQKFIDEFGCLFQGPNDPKLIAFVDAGKYIELPDLAALLILKQPAFSQQAGVFVAPNTAASPQGTGSTPGPRRGGE